MDTDSKLKELQNLFPTYTEEALLEVLVLCDGSVTRVNKLLGGCADLQNHAMENENDTPKTDKNPVKDPETHILSEKKSPLIKSVNISSILGTKRLANDSSNDGRPFKMGHFSKEKVMTLTTKHEIERLLPNIRVFPKFLPDTLLSEVVSTLNNQKLLFKAKEFYVAGNLCRSSQSSIFYSIDEKTDYDEVYASKDIRPQKFPNCLHQCKQLVDQKVNEILQELYKNNTSTPGYMISEGWNSNFCVGNYYRDNNSHLDWHTDKLTNIGPLPTIASLTFGATRIFRLRRSNPLTSTIYNIHLPNNMLLLMLPGTQELFKHCVPSLKDSLIKRDGKYGPVRFNLTFRMGYPYFEKSKVCCDKCGKNMILRRLFKGADIGHYVWMCMGSFKGTNCKGFKYADFSLKKDGTMNLSTSEKEKGTVWLHESESGLT